MKLKLVVITIALCALAALTSITMTQGQKIDALQGQLETAQTELATAKQEKIDLQKRYDEVSKIDKGYHDEINAIKRSISDLRDGIDNGSIRLYIKGSMQPATATTSGDNARACIVDPATGQDILTLREGIEQKDVQIRKLQEYIKTSCIRG